MSVSAMTLWIGMGYALLRLTSPDQDSLKLNVGPLSRLLATQFVFEFLLNFFFFCLFGQHLQSNEKTNKLLNILKENADSDRPVWDVRGVDEKNKE